MSLKVRLILSCFVFLKAISVCVCVGGEGRGSTQMDKKLKGCFRRSGNFRYSHGGYMAY